jgi:tetratricopeptide (TPR) repeat protein
LQLLVAGLVASTWQAVRATRAEEATRAALTAEAEQRRLAEQREAESRAVLDFVDQRVFAVARPEGQQGGLGREVTLRKAVESAVRYLAASFRDQPLVEARLRRTLGISFFYLGEAKLAAEHLEIARARYTKELGPDHPDTLLSMFNLALSYSGMGRRGDALKLREETLALRKAKLGPDHPDTLMSMNNLAVSYRDTGRYADALKLYEETLALRKAKLGPDHPDTLLGMTSLAIVYSDMGRHTDALKFREETLSRQKTKLGPDHPNTLLSMISLAISYAAVGRHQDALKLLEERRVLQAKLGPDHPDMLYNIACLHATIAKSNGRIAQAGVAVEWVKKAIAAGYKNAQLMKTDPDLAALRDRDDFKKVVTDLEAENAKKK